jgi:hypothetical protein
MTRIRVKNDSDLGDERLGTKLTTVSHQKDFNTSTGRVGMYSKQGGYESSSRHRHKKLGKGERWDGVCEDFAVQGITVKVLVAAPAQQERFWLKTGWGWKRPEAPGRIRVL